MKLNMVKFKNKGQTIAEYAIFFVIIVGVLVIALNPFNGPIRDSLSNVFTNLIDDISESIRNLAGIIL